MGRQPPGSKATLQYEYHPIYLPSSAHLLLNLQYSTMHVNAGHLTSGVYISRMSKFLVG